MKKQAEIELSRLEEFDQPLRKPQQQIDAEMMAAQDEFEMPQAEDKPLEERVDALEYRVEKIEEMYSPSLRPLPRFNKSEVLDKLVVVASYLDKKERYIEADKITEIIQNITK